MSNVKFYDDDSVINASGLKGLADSEMYNNIIGTDMLGLFKDSDDNFYFDDFIIAKYKNTFVKYFSGKSLSKNDVKIIVYDIDFELVKTFDYVNRFPTDDNIKSICATNSFDYVFMIYCSKDLNTNANVLITKTLNNPDQ